MVALNNLRNANNNFSSSLELLSQQVQDEEGKKLLKTISEFCLDNSKIDMGFSPTLSKEERQRVHDFAEVLELSHLSKRSWK